MAATTSAIASMARCSAVVPATKPYISAQTLPKRPAASKTPELSAEQAAPNQIRRMGGSALGLGLAAGLAGTPPHAEAIGEIAAAAEAAANDNRGQLLLIVVAPAILWVLYNILQPALNQINKMRSK